MILGIAPSLGASLTGDVLPFPLKLLSSLSSGQIQEEGESSFHFCNFCYLKLQVAGSTDDLKPRPGKVIGRERISLKSGSGPSRDLLGEEVKSWPPTPRAQ